MELPPNAAHAIVCHSCHLTKQTACKPSNLMDCNTGVMLKSPSNISPEVRLQRLTLTTTLYHGSPCVHIRLAFVESDMAIHVPVQDGKSCTCRRQPDLRGAPYSPRAIRTQFSGSSLVAAYCSSSVRLVNNLTLSPFSYCTFKRTGGFNHTIVTVGPLGLQLFRKSLQLYCMRWIARNGERQPVHTAPDADCGSRKAGVLQLRKASEYHRSFLTCIPAFSGRFLQSTRFLQGVP